MSLLLGFWTFTAVTQFHSQVGELKSCKLCGTVKKKKSFLLETHRKILQWLYFFCPTEKINEILRVNFIIQI